MGPILSVSLDSIANLPERKPQWLDERECCVLVNKLAHGGPYPDPRKLCECPAYAVGRCTRAGNGMMCAFHDRSFKWSKARDWQLQDDGSVVYAPRRAAKKATR